MGRLYFLFFIMAFEYAFCFTGRGPIPGHLVFWGSTSDTYGQIPIFIYIVFLGLGHFKLKAAQEKIAFSRALFAGHLLCIAVVFSLSVAAQRGLDWLPFDPYSKIKSAVYLLGTLLLVFACVPIRGWILAIRSTGLLWLYASVAGVAGWLLGTPIKYLWNSTSTVQNGYMQSFTLHAVSLVLRFFLPDLIVDPANFAIGTPRSTIIIAGGCSGVEGFGLVLIFTSLWLWYYRKNVRFPQALLLVPCALACSWLLNIVRLCALILIANAGGSDIAQVGFHAQAGWIAFILIALFFSLATQNLSWVRKAPVPLPSASDEAQGGEEHGESPAIRAYLIPFLAILTAAALAKASSGYFEWLYPLRFAAAVIALVYFWPELKRLDWCIGWVGPVVGVAVFLAWIGPVWWTHQNAASTLGPALAALSPTARWSWIAFRVAAAVITVPIAEELAFRGYLARRVMDREFDTVPFTSMTAFSVGLSSVAFGLMHGQHWMVGILAGAAYAFTLRWRGRMGDAVAAHAVSNLLLAGWVLGFGDWAQW